MDWSDKRNSEEKLDLRSCWRSRRDGDTETYCAFSEDSLLIGFFHEEDGYPCGYGEEDKCPLCPTPGFAYRDERAEDWSIHGD